MVEQWRARAAANGLAISHERLRSARLLAEAGQHRDAVSRAYYAMLDSANACLAARGIRTRSHTGTITQFGLQFIKTGLIPKEYGRWLARVEGERMDADYEVAKTFTQDDAKAALRMAEDFVAAVESLVGRLLQDLHHSP